MTKKVPWYFSNIAWGTPSFFFGYFSKITKDPLGTFRHVFHQKSTCTPPPTPLADPKNIANRNFTEYWRNILKNTENKIKFSRRSNSTQNCLAAL